MPSGSIPHGNQRPDGDNCHAKHATNSNKAPEANDTSYERALIHATAAPFISFPVAALLDQTISHRDKCVLMGMCWHANTRHLLWCSQQTLAEELHLPISKISESIAQLIAAGYVEIVRRAYRGAENPALRTNKYRVLWQNDQGDPDPDDLPRTSQADHTSRSGKYTVPATGSMTPIFPATGNHISRSGKQNNTSEHRDVDDGEETRVSARVALIDNILTAGHFPRQTNRAALAQLIAQNPQISDGEWEFQAAAAAEWFIDHERRLTLAAFGSWIVRYLRQQRQLEREEQTQQIEQESVDERPTQSRGLHRRGRPARRNSRNSGNDRNSGQSAARQPGVVAPSSEPEGEYTAEPWESEEDRIRRHLRELAQSRAAQARRN